jgi:hypothetical protein
MSTQRVRAQARLVRVPGDSLPTAPRPFRLTAPTPPEAAILDAVLRYLALDPRVAWAQRFNTGAHVITGTDARGQPTRRFVRYAFPGCSDVLGQLVTGHFLAIEAKAAQGRLTPAQTAFLATVARAGGLAIVARALDDVCRSLDAFCARLAVDATASTAARRLAPAASRQLEHLRPTLGD